MTDAPSYLRVMVAALTLALSGPCNNLTDLLWVAPGATIHPQIGSPDVVVNGRHVYRDGSASVSFEVGTDRLRLSRDVVVHFEALGWRQRANQYMNPQLPTSFSGGWQHRCACVLQLDAQGRPVQRGPLFEWTGEWENDRGDIAAYHFFAEGEHVHAYATIVPSRVVRAVLRRLVMAPAR